MWTIFMGYGFVLIKINKIFTLSVTWETGKIPEISVALIYLFLFKIYHMLRFCCFNWNSAILNNFFLGSSNLGLKRTLTLAQCAVFKFFKIKSWLIWGFNVQDKLSLDVFASPPQHTHTYTHTHTHTHTHIFFYL